MNLLSIILLAYIAIEALLGMKRGFFRSVLSLVIMLAAVVITYHFSPDVAAFIRKNTDIESTVEKQMVKHFSDTEEEPQSRKEKKEYLNERNLPEYIKDQISRNNNSVIYEALGVTSFTHYIAAYISSIIVNIVSYLITFLTVWVLLHLLGHMLDWICHLPILKGLNRVGGLLFGVAKGILFVAVFFLLLTLFSSTVPGKWLLTQIEENEMLRCIYEKNPLLDLVTDITKQIF